MASSNFDELTKALATSISRRQTIKVLFASVLAGALRFGGFGTALAAGCTEPCGMTSDTDFLWIRVQNCVKDSTKSYCVKVDSSHGKNPEWVALRGGGTSTNYLLLPAVRIAGIECDTLWKHQNPNYWDDAWQEATNLLPNDKSRIGLAVNSIGARGQCQLHIHMSCIRKDVQDALNDSNNGSKIAKKPEEWKSKILQLGPDKNAYHVLHLGNLTQDNLFWLLWNYVVGQKSTLMQYQTLVVTTGSRAGFYIINSAEPKHFMGANNGDGHGEKLLDEKCS
jgi:CDP-diacylglycerol pyrophosphatase